MAGMNEMKLATAKCFDNEVALFSQKMHLAQKDAGKCIKIN